MENRQPHPSRGKRKKVVGGWALCRQPKKSPRGDSFPNALREMGGITGICGKKKQGEENGQRIGKTSGKRTVSLASSAVGILLQGGSEESIIKHCPRNARRQTFCLDWSGKLAKGKKGLPPSASAALANDWSQTAGRPPM